MREAASNVEHEEVGVDVEAVYKGPRILIGFNVGYLLDVLADTRVGPVWMALNDAHSSLLITCPKRPDFQYVVSPMRLSPASPAGGIPPAPNGPAGGAPPAAADAPPAGAPWHASCCKSVGGARSCASHRPQEEQQQ